MKSIKLPIVAFAILLLTSFRGKDGFLWYPFEIGVLQTCEGQDVEFMVKIEPEFDKKVKLYGFSTDKSEFTISHNTTVLKKNDTVLVENKNPIFLKVQYKLKLSAKPTEFTFMTNMDGYPLNHINIRYGCFEVTPKEIKDGKEQVINITESCQDNIKIAFPFGGTISSVNLYADSMQTKKKLKSISYDLMDTVNYFSLSKADIGRYYVHYSSCYWANSFWLTVK